MDSGGRPVWPERTFRKSDKRSGNAFEGLRVADFSWVAAGPTISKALADHGATVVKVESESRPHLSRTPAPPTDGGSGPNRSSLSFLCAPSEPSLPSDLPNRECLQVRGTLGKGGGWGA
ncbi:MAG: CoA transferase, partial [Pseudomonadales bacterium]|nr:CoA transferase [Pseudomonadales bacterium]